jgi:chromate transporter
MFEVFRAFLLLGLSSFGGPVAHLGYFRREFVEKRGWLTLQDYGAIVGLCQFLPGPASSQAGFCIGLLRAGWPGGLAAWAGFTLPSAFLMFFVACEAVWFNSSRLGGGLLHGLQLAAIAVVAQAVWGMARSLCPDSWTRALALVALLVVALAPGAGGQLAVLAMGAGAGRLFLAAPAAGGEVMALKHRGGRACLAAFFVLLALALVVHFHGGLALFAGFYRAGALVFGGGHVVLPLLQSAVVAPGWVPKNLFLAGYGAAQAMPGPLFTVSAYLGALSGVGPGGLAGAAIALAAIFLPGLLLVAGVLPLWSRLRQNPALASAITGMNAAVVGLLGYALCSLVVSGPVHHVLDLVVACMALWALIVRKTPPIMVVACCAVAGVVL